MLDAETKRKIDGLRDTLVGKIPVPTEQVKQITLGLIYKFMSDIDAENEELGSKSFFNGEYQRYSWRYIMDRSLSSYDRVLLYSEGLEKMSLNPNIPQLFRDIFKGAFLPFRDPMVVDQFLKGINEFKYEHSEDLGDAFEYLLSVMGAQGKAGQFRTPRHIIDFIVKAVDPQKTDRILDPACGTAGFLISAYKHILEHNVDPKQKLPGSALTTVERNNLSKNFVGYDISHDMVRISLVNMYLHQFSEPNIYEYDTLGSLDRWDDNFDCILANPPFMTPKGGIRPHNRFSIKANRSEVLFVDYIAEHLNPSGKAGIIVPEGIIFQSANAYKSLRKMLVDAGYLWAVVSLPAGVFNPYSGVKTSILLIDKVLAKRAKDILFLKAENDGYDLGAQRREIQENDLPKVLAVIKSYKQALITGKVNSEVTKEKGFANLVPKARIAENGDFNLSGDRYKDVVSFANQQWPMVELREVCEILDSLRKPVTKADRKPGPYPYYGATGILDYVDDYIFDEKLVLIGEDGAKWRSGEETAFIAEGKYWVNNHAHVLRPNRKRIFDELLVHLLNQMDLSSYITGVTVPKLNQEKLRSIKIPLPSYEVQQQIVAELDGYQKIIDGAKQVIANYKPTIKIDPSWEMVELGEVFLEIRNGKNVTQKDEEGKYRVTRIQTIADWVVNLEKTKWTDDDISENDFMQDGDILLSHINSMAHLAKSAIFRNIKEKVVHGTNLIRLRPYKNRIDPMFACHILKSDFFIEKARSFAQKAVNQASIKVSDLKSIMIPLPPLETQKQIVTQIEEEQKLVEMNKKLVEMFEQKIKEKIDEVWGK